MEQKSKWQKRVRWFSISAVIIFTIVRRRCCSFYFKAWPPIPLNSKSGWISSAGWDGLC